MSNIIKGPRVRNESTYKMKNVVQSFVPNDEDKKLDTPKQEEKPDPDIIIKKSRLEAEKQAATIIKESKEQAKQMIADAKTKADQESSAALEKAKQEGYTEGYEEGKQTSQKLIEEGEKIVKEAKEEKKSHGKTIRT